MSIREQDEPSESVVTGLGWFEPDVMRQVESTFFDLGLTKNRFDMDAAYTNEFVEQG